MNLFDPSRPKIGHKPAFRHGMSIIPKIYIFPLQNGLVELKVMLPLVNERLMAKEFRSEIKPEKLPELISQFISSPEDLFSNLFTIENGQVPLIAQEPSIKSWAKEERKYREENKSPMPNIQDLLSNL